MTKEEIIEVLKKALSYAESLDKTRYHHNNYGGMCNWICNTIKSKYLYLRYDRLVTDELKKDLRKRVAPIYWYAPTNLNSRINHLKRTIKRLEDEIK